MAEPDACEQTGGGGGSSSSKRRACLDATAYELRYPESDSCAGAPASITELSCAVEAGGSVNSECLPGKDVCSLLSMLSLKFPPTSVPLASRWQ